MRTSNASCRRGITLLELLIVMAIIGALASLAIGAVFSMRESQIKSVSETTVQKLASALDQQWKAAIDQIREETVPTWALQLAGKDSRRAQVVYIKARLKQEFPVTFYGAKNPHASQSGQVFMDNTQIPPVLAVSSFNLPPKPAYANALSTVTLGPASPAVAPATASPAVPYPAAMESSALLYLALTQSRRGMSAFTPEDHVGSSAIQLQTFTDSAGVQTSFKVFVDAWGNPIQFVAFPYDCAELNAAPYYDPTNKLMPSPDPLDRDQTFKNYATVAPSYAANFAQIFHPLDTVNPIRNLTPVVTSWGRDGIYGENTSSTLSVGRGLLYMNMDPSNGYSNDNICSYRLRRFGQRGD